MALPFPVGRGAAGPQDPPPDGVPWTDLAGADGRDFVPARPRRGRPDPGSSGSEAEPKMVAYFHDALAVASVVPIAAMATPETTNASPRG